jgi:hypothetical protein
MIRDIDGEIVVLDTRANQIHQLNRTASIIWRLYDAGGSPETIAAVLTREYEVEHETARMDVVETLSRCQSLGLIDEP